MYKTQSEHGILLSDVLFRTFLCFSFLHSHLNNSNYVIVL
jgi:hypothetical protein